MSLPYKLPDVLQVAPALLPLVEKFDDYSYFLLEGGRNGMKSETIARFLLTLGDQYELNIVCGREVQNKIEESVYTLLVEKIRQYNLAYRILANELRSIRTGTTFTFRGFQDLSAEDIKGLQGVDILWVDEAQSLKKRTVQVIIPTIRKQTSKLIFSMNRKLVNDPVFEEFAAREDCLHLYVTYLDNPWLPPRQLAEAEKMKAESIKDYNHIWLGLPMAAGEDYLFNIEKLYQCYEIDPIGDLFRPARVLSLDFAAQGSDRCVGSILDRVTNTHWKLSTREGWREPDPMVSIGRIVVMIGTFKPDLVVIDAGGMGYVVWARLVELGFDVQRFDGGSTDMVETKDYANQRAEGYYTVAQWVNNGWLMLDRKDEIVVKQFERIRFKYRSNGQRLIRSKNEMREEGHESPDDADSVMMGVWVIVKLLGKTTSVTGTQTVNIKRISRSRR